MSWKYKRGSKKEYLAKRCPFKDCAVEVMEGGWRWKADAKKSTPTRDDGNKPVGGYNKK